MLYYLFLSSNLISLISFPMDNRESGRIHPKIFRHSDINPFVNGFLNDNRMTEWDRNDRNEIKKYPIFLRNLGWWEWKECPWNDWKGHSNVIPVIPSQCHSASFQCSNDHGMNGMTSEWQYIVNMNYDWWNDTRMVEWHLNDGKISEWARNEGMT